MKNARIEILRHFLRASGQFISGSAIAADLGLSRVAVHNHLESLREEGFAFDAIRNKGYRLSAEPEPFHADLFSALLLEEPCPWFRGAVALDSVGSTNSEAERLLANGTDTPFLVIAKTQTAGRGRRGRSWHSPPDRNLYLSAAFCPSMPASRLQTITLWTGLCLCRFLRDSYGLPVMVKWPNDLMLHGKKVAGILTEARVDAETTRDLVLGLGINVNARPEDFPAELSGIATSLAIALGHPLSVSRLAHRIVRRLAEAFGEYFSGEFSPEFAHQWPEFDFLRGERVSTGTVEGRAAGIASTGSLRIERDDGSIALLHSGEVGLLKK